MKLFLNLSENLKEKILIFVLMLLITFFVGAKIVSSLESPDPEIKLIIKEAQWSSESKVDNLKLDLTIGFSNEVKHDNIYLVNDVPLYGYSYEISDSGGLVGRTQSIYNCGKGQNNEYRGDSFFPSSEDISKQANIYSIPFLVNLKPIYFPDNKYDPNETYEIMVKADYWDGNDKDFYAFESNKSKIVSPVSCKNPEKIDSERVSLEPTHDSIKIKWSKIDNWGDNQLNDDGREYIVKISKDSDVIEENFVSHLSTKIDYDLVFTNLEPNKHYDISIQTKNIAELSSEELIFWEQTLLTRPDIPGDFKVQKIGSDYVKLAWNKVNNWGDSKEYHKARESNETEDELETSTLPAEWPPKKYILEYKENNKNNWSKIELEFDDESETINGLKHNTLYNFRISSFNFERDSGFTSVNARTTKKFNYNDPDESSSESDLVDKDSESTEEENNNNQSEEQNEIIQPEIPTPLPIQTYTLNDIKTPEYFKTRDFINGYENKTFKPDQNLTRAEAAQMFYKISYDGTKINFETLNKFNDINEKDWFSNSVAYLANKNLVQGFENKFNPNEKITRAEFSQLIFNVLNNYADKDKILILGKYDTNFEDIENSFAKKVIKQLASNNFVNGYDFKNFKPQDNITRAESIVMITKVFKRDISENKENIFIDLDRNHWAYKFIVSCVIV